MHERLRRQRTLLPTVERLARQLKASHAAWITRLSRTRPASESQIAEAMEAGPPATGFVFRIASANGRRALPPGGRNGVPPPSYAARVKA